MIYEVVSSREAAEMEVGGTFLKETALSAAETERIGREARRWQAVEQVRYEKTLYWHNDDQETGSYQVVHSGAPWVIKDGGFYGLLVRFRDTDSFGMSSHAEEKTVLLCVDGSVFGEGIRHAGHTGTETDTTEVGTFSLQRLG